MKKVLSLLFCSILAVQLVSCGTLLYPERDGQKTGTLDLTVVLLDGVGLLFGIIPGVIAFAVDLHTGAIYLPPGHPRSKKDSIIQADEDKLYVLKIDPNGLNMTALLDILTEETGIPVRMDDPNLILKKTKKSVDIAAELARLSRITSESSALQPD